MKYIDMWGRKAKGVVFNPLWSEVGYGVMCSLKPVSEMVLCVFFVFAVFSCTNLIL